MWAKTLAVFLSFAVVCTLYSSQEPKWKGTITTEKGVKIVSNPEDPLYGDIKLDIIKDLSIGNEEDDNYLFFGIIDIMVDAERNIYVLERGNRRIQKFDSNGKYLQSIGRAGQGPGEFMYPKKVLMEPGSNSIAVWDDRFLKFLSLDGKFLDRDIKLNAAFGELFLGSNNSIYGHGLDVNEVDEDGISRKSVVMRVKYTGEVLNRYASYPHIIYTMRGPGGGIGSVSTGHGPRPYMAILSNEVLVYGFSQEYELRIVDSDGRESIRILKDTPLPKYTDEEIEAFELRKKRWKDLKLEERKPYFYFIYSDDMDRIYVQRNKGRRSEEGIKELEVFSKDGYYLYKTEIPVPLLVLQKGNIYTYSIDEETGNSRVLRFRIKNWDQLKSGLD